MEKILKILQERPKILIVYDDAANLPALKDYITSWGFETDSAPNGYSAMRRILEGRPDVIIIDGDLRGWESLRVVEAAARLGSRAPVVMLSEPEPVDIPPVVRRRVVGIVDRSDPVSSLKQLIVTALERRYPRIGPAS
ncbi:response regulator receiver domain-containing protein [Zavarzinia compransoris]|nr:response regulator [Zavarzinia compransoris]TDP49278.1 response regulator receiver domain-containing protein [Zavarzinia compransoris]